MLSSPTNDALTVDDPSLRRGEGTPRVIPVCPACRGALRFAADAVACPRCARSYPLVGPACDFLAGHGDAEKVRQKAIYDGRSAAGINLVYGDREDHARRHDDLRRRIKSLGLPHMTMRSAMNDRMFRRCAFEPGMEVLDIGSGSGYLLNTLHQLFGVRGTGIDISHLAVRRSHQVNPAALAFHLADAELLPFADGSFHRVVSFDVLEHLPDQRRALFEAVRVLQPGGRLLFYAISSADRWTWHWTQRELTAGRVGVDDGGGHRRELFLAPPTVRDWLLEAGCGRIAITPFHAFFTLMVDERLQSVSELLARCPLLFRALFQLTLAADRSWTAAGLGNGFFFTAEKSA